MTTSIHGIHVGYTVHVGDVHKVKGAKCTILGAVAQLGDRSERLTYKLSSLEYEAVLLTSEHRTWGEERGARDEGRGAHL